MKKPSKSATKLRADHFAVWVTLPKTRRPALRSAAGKLDLPMSEFARAAVEEAIRRVEAGEEPFGGEK